MDVPCKVCGKLVNLIGIKVHRAVYSASFVPFCSAYMMLHFDLMVNCWLLLLEMLSRYVLVSYPALFSAERRAGYKTRDVYVCMSSGSLNSMR